MWGCQRQRGTLGQILTEDEGVLRDGRVYRDGLCEKCGFPSGKHALRLVRRVDPSARVNLMDNPSSPGS